MNPGVEQEAQGARRVRRQDRRRCEHPQPDRDGTALRLWSAKEHEAVAIAAHLEAVAAFGRNEESSLLLRRRTVEERGVAGRPRRRDADQRRLEQHEVVLDAGRVECDEARRVRRRRRHDDDGARRRIDDRAVAPQDGLRLRRRRCAQRHEHHERREQPARSHDGLVLVRRLALLDENGGDGRGQKRTVTAVAPAPAVDPTFNEPWGLVANEAMNQRCAVIATDAVGAAAGGLVRHERTGLVVSAGDTAALGRAIRRLHADGPLRERLAEAGARAVAAYTYEAWAAGFSEALRPGSPAGGLLA